MLRSISYLLRLFGLAVCAWPTAAQAQLLFSPGAEFAVNSYTTGSQQLRSAVQLSSGSYLVVWNEYGAVIPARTRRVGSDGGPIGTEFQLPITPTDIAVGVDGNLMAVGSGSGDGDGAGVAGLLLSNDGVPIGTEFQINSYTTEDQRGASLSARPTGGFVVAWYGYGSSTNSYGSHYEGIDARVLSSAGTPLGPQFRISDPEAYYGGGLISAARPFARPDGQFLVVWSYVRSSGSDNLDSSFRLLDSGATPVGSVTDGGSGPATAAVLPDSSFVLASHASWIDLYQDIHLRRFDSEGAPQGASFLANSYTSDSQSYASVAAADSGEFIVVWASGPSPDGEDAEQDGDESGIFGQVFDSLGSRVGTEFQVNAYTTGNQTNVKVIANADQGFFVAWESERDGDERGIAARQFLPLCGDGIAIFGEECDDGNLADSDGCDADCALSLCLSPSGEQDITTKPSLSFRRINNDTTPDNDSLSLRGEFTLPTSFTNLDPILGGARLVIDAQDGTTRIDITLPSGSYDGTSGWRVNGTGTKFQYKDKAKPPTHNGINKVLIQDRSQKVPNQIKIQVKGKSGTYPVVSGDEPVKAILVVGDGALGECGQTAFVPGECRFSGSGSSLKCKQ